MSDDTENTIAEAFMPDLYKRLIERTTEIQNERNLEKFLNDIVKEAPELTKAAILIVNSEDKFGLAKAMLGFDIDVQYAESFVSVMARQMGKSVFPAFDFDSIPNLGEQIYIKYMDDNFVGETGPAKPEPDWKHPIPVSVKSDGPSKQKRAKLRAKRKK